MEYMKKVSNTINEVFVFWDIHMKERILIENYWNFGKETVLKLYYKELLENMNYLPEDIYIFDESLTWTLILTHEYIDDNTRWCLKSGNIKKTDKTILKKSPYESYMVIFEVSYFCRVS